MAGLLVPDHYEPVVPTEDDLLIATLIWGFTLASGVFTAAKAARQTRFAWQRTRRTPAYIVMIWAEWTASTMIGLLSWLFIKGIVPVSFWVFFFLLCLWVVQIQCICGIIINRVGLLIMDRWITTRLRWSVAMVLGLVNISVFCLWIPAHLQISQRFIDINEIWDRLEKVIFLIVDAGLNLYFVFLVRTRLIDNGLTKYRTVFRFNMFMMAISVALDVVLIGSMSISTGIIYIQFHPLTYMLKLYIEMNMADLIAKVVKASNNLTNSYSHGNEMQPPSHGIYPKSGGTRAQPGDGGPAPAAHAFNATETRVEGQGDGAHHEHVAGAGIMKTMQTKVTSRRRESSLDEDHDSSSSTRHLKGADSDDHSEGP